MKVKGERQGKKKKPKFGLVFLQLLERRCCLCSLSLPVFPLLDEIPEYSCPSVYFTWVFYRSHPALSPLEFPVQGHLVLSLLLNEHRQGAPQQTANAFAFTLCSAGSSGSSTAWNIPIPMVFTPFFNISTTSLHKSITLPTASAYFCSASLEPGEFLVHRKAHFLVEGLRERTEKPLPFPKKPPEMRPLLQERRCPGNFAGGPEPLMAQKPPGLGKKKTTL